MGSHYLGRQWTRRPVKPRPGISVDPSHPLSQGLIACWLFNEGGGDVLHDYSGQGHHGALTAMAPATDWIIGPRGGALDFAGDNDYVLAPVATVQTANVTLSAWFSTSDYTSTRQGILFNGNGNDDGYGIVLNNDSSIDGSLFVLYGGIAWFDTGTDITDSDWYHVTLVVDASSDPHVYLNGSWIYSSNGTPNAPTKTTIGWDSKANQYFSGRIDDCRIWNRALSADGVRWQYEQPYDNFLSLPVKRYYVAAAPPAGNVPQKYYHYAHH